MCGVLLDQAPRFDCYRDQTSGARRVTKFRARHPEAAAKRPSKGDGPGAEAVSFEARRHGEVPGVVLRGSLRSHLRMTPGLEPRSHPQDDAGPRTTLAPQDDGPGARKREFRIEMTLGVPLAINSGYNPGDRIKQRI
jgi:hypothetical protein